MVFRFRHIGIFLLSVFFLISCDNEPLSEDIELSNPTVPGGVNLSPDSILGTWQISSQSIEILQTIFISFAGQSLEETQIINMNQDSGDIMLTFTEDGQFTSSGAATLIITGEQSGQSLPETTESGVNGFAGGGTWMLNNGVLTLVLPESEENFTVISFTETNMDLFSNEELPSFNSILNSGGVPDIEDLLGAFGDFPDLTFNIDQEFESQLSLTKIE